MKSPTFNEALADLTYAALWSKKIQIDLRAIMRTVRKVAATAELLNDAALLRWQLAGVNRTMIRLKERHVLPDLCLAC